MANLHVLERDPQTSDVRVAAHIPVPIGNNLVGVSWVNALLNSGLGGTTILKDGDGTAGTISATEKASIIAGALYEVVVTLRVTTVPLAGANAFLDLEFTRIQSETLTRLQSQLNYFGKTR